MDEQERGKAIESLWKLCEHLRPDLERSDEFHQLLFDVVDDIADAVIQGNSHKMYHGDGEFSSDY